MKSLKIFILFSLPFFYTLPGKTQLLTYEQGEVLIAMDKGDTPRKLVDEYRTFRGDQTKIKAIQIIAEPMNIWCLSFDYKKINENEFQESVRNREEVRITQKNFKSTYRLIPNDPDFSKQWQFINDGSSGGVANFDTDADRAWDITTGGITTAGDSIVVCIIDDGINPNHEDLKANLWINHLEIPDNNIDDDNNGYVDDIYGWDSLEDDGNISREGQHGTAVAGIVGASGNNGIGVTGVNWQTKLMIVRGGSNATNGIKAYTYPYLMRKRYNDSNGLEGAYVVATNASWGFEEKFEFDAPIFCEFYDLLGEVGILNAAATTNTDRNVEEDGDLPSNCSSPYLITVTNLQRDGTKRVSAGYGEESIDLAAPGEGVFTTGIDNRYRSFSGTSGSSPHVAGTIGLLYATDCAYLTSISKAEPAEAALLSRELVLGGAVYNIAMKGFSVTEGNLNIGNSIELANNLCNACPFPADLDYIANDQQITLSWNKPDNVEKIQLRYRIRGNENWTFVNNLDSNFEIENVAACEVYEVQLRGNCGNQGPYGPVYFVKSDKCCTTPKEIKSIIDGNNINITWEEITASTSFQIEYKDKFDNEWLVDEVNINEYTIPGLSNCSGYQYRVKTICNLDFTKFTPIQDAVINCDACQEQAYCEDVFMDNEYEWIETIILDTTIISSGIDVAGYGNYVGSPIANITKGTNMEIKVVPGFSSGSFEEYALVFIDWDQNGNFDNDEFVLASDSASDTLSGIITAPQNALSGNTRMRVILSFEEFDISCKDLTLEYGEIEDYCIRVKSIGACNNSINIEGFTSTLNSMTVLWTDIENAEEYDLEFRLLGENSYTRINSLVSTLVIDNLDDCASYEVRIRGYCGGSPDSFSNITKIDTKCGNNALHTGYPNPFSDQFAINFSENVNQENLQINLYDLRGQLLYQKKNIDLEGKNTLIIEDINHLPSGVLILEIINGDLHIGEKIIKI